MLFAILLACSVWGSLTNRERGRERFMYEPPHPAIVRWLITPRVPDADLICTASLLDMQASCTLDSSPAIRSSPVPVARAGHAYHYRPSSARSITEWSVAGGPDGLVVDAATGVLSGQFDEQGVYDVVLTGRLNADSAAQQKFTLFVDNRYLVLGANAAGSDVFAMLVRSTRYMVLAGFIAVPLGVITGMVIGALAGFYGGALRRWLGAIVSVLQSIPGLVLVIVAAAASDLQHGPVLLVVGIILIPEVALGMAERVEHFRRRDFVEAARELGMRDRDILWREIVWHNTRDFVLNRIANGFVFAILMEITLSYLGLLNAQSGSLGKILGASREALLNIPQSTNEAVAAIVGLTMVIVTFALLDRGVRSAWKRAS